jgi:hypothetical protein
MSFDLNTHPPDQVEALTDLNEPPDREPFQIHGVLPDLNEKPPNAEEPIQIHEAQQSHLAGGQQENNPGKMFHNFISATSTSAKMKFDICNCADIASLHADDEDHQPNVVGQAIPDLNVPPTDNDCQADGDVTFVVPDEQDYFDISLKASAQYEEMQESMITDLCLLCFS